MILLKKEILILVKTYPEISKKYIETVCVAGILKDTHEMIRIYPIRFRYIDKKKQFKKYDLISIDVQEKSAHDNRLESFTVDPYSTEIIEREQGKAQWLRRCKYILDSPHLVNDVETLKSLQKEKNISLGIVKPSQNIKFRIEKRPEDEIKINEIKKRSVLDQGDLFEDIKNLEAIPYRFKVNFKCKNPECRGHDMSILDWEIAELYRNCKKNKNWEKMILNKLESMCDFKKREPYFILGNMNQWRHIFCVLGIFYPPNILQDELF